MSIAFSADPSSLLTSPPSARACLSIAGGAYTSAEPLDDNPAPFSQPRRIACAMTSK